MRPWHITWSTEGRLSMFPEEATRLEAVNMLARVGGEDLALFNVVDDHVHTTLQGTRQSVGQRNRAFTACLRRLGAVHIEGPRVRPINGRSHMDNTLGYVLNQSSKHGLPGHPALWSGSCLPDLVGARRLPGMRSCLSAIMPRITVSEIMGKVGLPPRPLQPVGMERVRRAGAFDLARVTAAAMGTTLPLTRQLPHVVAAKRALCVLARRAGLDLTEVAEAGGFSKRSARRLARQQACPEVLRTVLMRFDLEDRVALREGRSHRA